MNDVFSALLRHVRIEASRFGRIELGAPWAARLGPRGSVTLHYLLEGELWLTLAERQTHVVSGDLLILPHGAPHAICCEPGEVLEADVAWDESVELAQGAGGLPACQGEMSGAVAGRGDATALAVHRRFGGGGKKTIVLCAELTLSGAARTLLLHALPPVVHVRGESTGEPSPGFERLLDGIRAEVHHARPGAPLIAARLAELLLLEGLRVELERPGALGSWRAALVDPRIARTLQALYAAPEQAWTVASLARTAGMSRAAFAQRFRELVGQSPLEHLTFWRMELAQALLRDSVERPLSAIAASVGYASEAAFSVAFRRAFGLPPGAYRAAQSAARPSR